MQEILKNKILHVTEVPVNTPKDCNALAEAIGSSTNRHISATSLRRFFGLLPTKSSFSKYNLDTLAIYAGYPDYNSFCKRSTSDSSGQRNDFEGIRKEFKQLTQYTLTSIFRKSLAGFQYTIPRLELNKKLDYFLNSNHSVFPVIAPGGYGKSIALAHWISSLTDYDCLLCPAPIFYSMIFPNGSRKSSLKLELSDPENLFRYLSDNYEDHKKPWIIAIDAIDEISNEPEKLVNLIDYIFDATSLYGHKNSCRIVFSIRESAWQTYLNERLQKVESNQGFQKRLPIFESGYTNIPLLSNSEIHQIVSKYNGSEDNKLIFESIPWDIRELMRVPILLHFASEILSGLDSIEHITLNDITSEYLKKFISRSKFAQEKEDIIWRIIELMGRSGNKLHVLKSDLKKVFPIHLKRETAYYQAYQDLLHAGILYEERNENYYGVFVTSLGFKHLNFFVWLYSQYQINENEGNCTGLFEKVCKLDIDDAFKSEVIATIYEIAYNHEDLEALKNFCSLPDHILGSWKVQHTVGSNFRKINKIRDDLIRIYAANEKGRTYFFEHFVDINYLVNNYEFRLSEYLKHVSSIENRLFAYSILHLSGFLKLDRNISIGYYSIIKTIYPDTSVYPWPIGRKVAAHIIHKNFIEEDENSNTADLIEKYTKIAHAYPGYLENGLVEFELYILLALLMVKDYRMLMDLSESVQKIYLPTNSACVFDLLFNSQNSIPGYCLEFAKYKLGKSHHPDLAGLFENAINHYATTFDDFQFLIFLNIFLFDIYTYQGETESALAAYNSAMNLSCLAQYSFYEALLLNNHPNQQSDQRAKAQKMISDSGFEKSLFTLCPGPCFE